MAGNVTRRDFMRLATDSLVYLPSVLGGFLAVMPQQALAVDGTEGSWDYEKDGGAYNNAEAQVIAVSPNEVGFMVVDMSDGGNTRVAGARVVVKSRHNNMQAEGMTDAQGIVVLDIAGLAENPNNLAVLSEYKFNGSIAVTCSASRAAVAFACPLVTLAKTGPIPRVSRLTTGMCCTLPSLPTSTRVARRPMPPQTRWRACACSTRRPTTPVTTA